MSPGRGAMTGDTPEARPATPRSPDAATQRATLETTLARLEDPVRMMRAAVDIAAPDEMTAITMTSHATVPRATVHPLRTTRGEMTGIGLDDRSLTLPATVDVR